MDGLYARVNTNWDFSKTTNDSATQLANSATSVPAANAYGLVRVWLNAATQANARVGTTALSVLLASTDTTYPSAGYFFGRIYATSNIDWLTLCSSVLITCTGIPTGGYLKVTDGTTTAKAAASGGTATVDANAVIFPLTYAYVYDGDPDAGGNLLASIAAAALADMGGGDAFVYAADASASFIQSIMRPQIIGGPSIGI